MLMITLPPFASEIAAALIGFALALVVVVLRRRPVAAKYDDTEDRIADLTLKVRTKARHPYTYPVRLWMARER